MTNSKKFFSFSNDKFIILSIKPRYADLILSGKKTVEFRRIWAAQPVDIIAIYASSPVKKIVGLVKVSEIIQAQRQKLWECCINHGGGLTKKELMQYFQGKNIGNAVMLKNATKFKKAIDPKSLIKDFYPPQSFQYLTSNQIKKLKKISIGEIE